MNATQNIIPKGYKQTKVGVIPEDWEVRKFENCFDHLRTYTFSRNELTYESNDESIFNVHYGDIHSRFTNFFLDIRKNIEQLPSVSNAVIDNPILLENGDIIMADASEDYDGVGKSVEICNVENRKIIAGTHTFALRPKHKFAPFYGGYIFADWTVHKSLKRIATGISVFGLSKSNISKIPLPIPPLPEQEAIADCLTTWDKAIEKQKALIKAKKLQKKGLMQNLLTGKIRLAGFTEDWKEVRLEDIGEFKTSSVNKKIVEDEIEIRLLNYMDVYRNTHIDSRIDFQTTTVRESQMESSNLLVGDVLFTPSSETPNDIGHSAVVIEELPYVVYSYHLVRFRPKNKKLDITFSGFIFNKSDILNEFSRRATGSTRYTLSLKDFKEVKTSIPSLKEQTAIAEILQIADKEIDLLEESLKNLELQKKGLMQVLLTGKKRLV